MSETKILCVDDDARVLDGIELHLAMEYDVHLATSGAQGLEILAAEGPFAVIVSDMRMPQMNGAEFLKRAKELAPDATRILLTGQADVESTASAINDGNVFRFLHKPCPPDRLLATVAEGVRQNQLILSERELLSKTLAGAAQILAEVIELLSPASSSRTSALTSYVKHLCGKLALEETWEIELAARLGQLGCITVPTSTLDQYNKGQELSAAEAEMFNQHAVAGERLLSNIPRLERVAKMVGGQLSPPPYTHTGEPSDDAEMIALGCHMLHIASAFDRLLVAGQTPAAAAQKLGSPLAAHLADYDDGTPAWTVSALSVAELRATMVLDQPVLTLAGQMLVVAEKDLTEPLIAKLVNFARGVGVAEPVHVRVPTGRTTAAP